MKFFVLGGFSYVPKEADIQVLVEKDQTIQELRETIEVINYVCEIWKFWL